MKKNIYVVMMALGFFLAACEGGNMIQFLIVKIIAGVLMCYGGKKYEETR